MLYSIYSYKIINYVPCVILYTLVALVACLASQLCPDLCDLMDCSPLGSSVHGISQARILE